MRKRLRQPKVSQDAWHCCHNLLRGSKPKAQAPQFLSAHIDEGRPVIDLVVLQNSQDGIVVGRKMTRLKEPRDRQVTVMVGFSSLWGMVEGEGGAATIGVITVVGGRSHFWLR